MCFTTTKSARAKIAKEDIVCWKFLSGNFYAPFRCIHRVALKYRPNIVQPKIRLYKRELFADDYRIYEGYHSYISRETAKKDFAEYHFKLSNGEKWHKFIIPAGTRYFENKTQYVSETIMLVK